MLELFSLLFMDNIATLLYKTVYGFLINKGKKNSDFPPQMTVYIYSHLIISTAFSSYYSYYFAEDFPSSVCASCLVY